MSEYIEILVQVGFPMATLIFLVYKGIPWLDAKNDRYNSAIKSLIEQHEKKMLDKDEKIDQIIKDNQERHQWSMRIIEANTKAITSLSGDIYGLKETNIQLREQIQNTESLTAQVKGFLEGYKTMK